MELSAKQAIDWVGQQALRSSRVSECRAMERGGADWKRVLGVSWPFKGAHADR